MKASHLGAAVLVLSGLMTFTASAADIEAGKQKSAVCAACHGADGNSANGAWPSLAGQHATYTYKQLMDFKEGRRVNASMTSSSLSSLNGFGNGECDAMGASAVSRPRTTSR